MSKSSATPVTEEVPVEAEEIATHQEAVPLPYLAGTRKIAGRWISPATDMIAIQTYSSVGKK